MKFYPDISAVVEGGKALHIKSQFILQEPGNYRIENPDGSVNGLGTWETSGETFTTVDEQGEKTIYTVEKLDH
jgi:hypothetical protein